MNVDSPMNKSASACVYRGLDLSWRIGQFLGPKDVDIVESAFFCAYMDLLDVEMISNRTKIMAYE